MNDAVNTSIDPATSDGTSRKLPASFGEKARINRTPDATKAMARPAAPVTLEMPTRLGAMLIPGAPSMPPMRRTVKLQ
jgi:hypothetical protein